MKSIALPRALVIALAVPAFVACSHTQTTSLANGEIAPATDIEVVPISASEADMLRRMTDANRLGHMAMGDSVEVVMAQMAEKRSKNDDVLNFARQMDVDHNTSLMAERNLAKTTGLGINTMTTELKLSHMGPMVDSIGPQISEVTFDRNYILAAVQMHSHMLGELQELQASAHNQALRDHIAATIPVVQGHLNRAREIAHKYDWASKKKLHLNP